MKKRVVLVIVAILSMLTVCTFGLSACGPEIKNFKLSFKIGEEVYATITTNGEEAITIPEDPEKEGYVFDGWFWDKDVWAKPFTANSLLDAPISSDMSVYAKFKVYGCEIVWHNVDGANNENPSDYDATERAFVLKPASKTGYTFDGWYTDENFTDAITEIAQGTTGEINLYAKWTIKEYNAIFKNGDEIVDTVKFTIETETLAEPQVPARTGYDGKWESYTLGAKDITINAVYTAKTYTLSFDYDGADGNKDTESKTVTYDMAIGTLPTPTKTGYEFVKWTINGEDITDRTVWKKTENITAKAIWKKLYSEGLEFTLIKNNTAYSVSKGTCADTKIVIPSSYNNLPVTSIRERAFYNCSSLTSITIPDSVTSIGDDAFYACSSLRSITIGNSVKSIEWSAFKGCSSLKDVTFTGTKAQWNSIIKGSGWALYAGDYTVHCTDGDI